MPIGNVVFPNGPPLQINYWNVQQLPADGYPLDRMTEFLAPARQVRAPIYHGANWRQPRDAMLWPNWNACSDNSDGPVDGYGNCTGTSMSAPLISGLIGLMRSTIPLARLGYTDVPPMSPDQAPLRLPPTGLRKILADNPISAQMSPIIGSPGLPQAVATEVVGYGVPDAEAVMLDLLGSVGNLPLPVRNRISPMYTLFSYNRTDLAQTANPHLYWPWRYLYGFLHVPWMFNAMGGMPQAPAAQWWGPEGGTSETSLRRAPFYIFTTHVLPVKEWVGFQMQPVFHIGRPRTAIEGQLVDPTDYEHQLAIGETDLNARLDAGYRLLGRQGYVVAPVTFAQCSEIGLVALKRFQGPASAPSTGALPDFVILPENYMPTGYSSAQSGVLGCAVPMLDSDGDGLPDAFEQILGTYPSMSDSDGDGCSDGFEYPLDAAPRSNPMLAGDCS